MITRDDFLLEVVHKYDEYLRMGEKRGINSKEISYFQAYNSKELLEIYRILIEMIEDKKKEEEKKTK